jgi:hypothetical protein
MRMRLLFCFALIALFILSVISCQKPDDPTPTNPQTPPRDSTVSPVDTVGSSSSNTWQCEIDGKLYKGTIDTCIFKQDTLTHPDTVVLCSGTALDKKANIIITIRINRYFHPGIITTFSSAQIYFDTVSTNNLYASGSYGNVNFQVDSINKFKIALSFSGKLENNPYDNMKAQKTLTNGKLSCQFGKGNSEPKLATIESPSESVATFVNYASFYLNSLFIYGRSYIFPGNDFLTLIVHTGASIKPGVYSSKKGQVGFSLWQSSRGYPFFVTDSVGDLTVTISSIANNIVTGSYVGTSRFSNAQFSGRFVCRLKSYEPYADDADKWKWIDINDVSHAHNIFGGNTLGAFKSNSAGVHQMSIDGESDNGATKFKVVIRAYTPIDTGVYYSQFRSFEETVRGKKLDSLYIKSLDGTKYYFSLNGGYYCVIDSISNGKVFGKIRQRPIIYPPYDKRGSFSALIK